MARKINDIESVKNLLIEKDLSFVLNKLLKNEKKDLSIIKLLQKALSDNKIIEKIKNENDILVKKDVKLYVYSKMMTVLVFYKKNAVLDSFLASLSERERKQIATYEYKNKTDITIKNETFDKYCLKYKINFLQFPNEAEILELTQRINIYNDMLKKPKKDSKKGILKKVLIGTCLTIIVSCGSYMTYNYVTLSNKYKSLIYPGIYVNNIDLTGKTNNEVKEILSNEKSKLLSKKIKFFNINGDYEYTLSDLNISLEDDKISNEIINYNNNLSFFNRLIMLNKSKKRKVFPFSFSYKEEDINSFVDNLKNNVNKEVRNDAIIRNENYDVYYDPGVNGFNLDTDDIKDKVIKLLDDYENDAKIELKGEIISKEVKNEHLSSIDTKISSYTTYFSNYGNRGSNLVLATQRLNGAVVMPNEEFSYTSVVGPYTYDIGYKVATAYVNGEVSSAIGGGVCQLASTLYNAELKAGLTTTARKNHIFAQDYVPKGLDATIYSNTVDLKFKNELQYPIYISSYVIGGSLNVDIWSNSKAIEGKRFEPYAVYSNGGYHAYLNVYENDTLIETRYLNSSYYKAHY